jgi:eukaryotic-like serine/threonine-protein kinase
MLVGKTLRDRYHLVRELGQGAFGQTYQAEDRQYRSNVSCVVKHLRPQIPAEYKKPEERAEFLRIAQDLFRREAAVLEKLGKYSAQIPTLLDAFEENNEFYLVQIDLKLVSRKMEMELVELK